MTSYLVAETLGSYMGFLIGILSHVHLVAQSHGFLSEVPEFELSKTSLKQSRLEWCSIARCRAWLLPCNLSWTPQVREMIAQNI